MNKFFVWSLIRDHVRALAGSFLLGLLAVVFIGSPLRAEAIGPDLLVTSVSGPSSGQTDQNVTLTATLRNQGQEDARDLFHVGFYLSGDVTIDSSDFHAGDSDVGYFAAGTEQTITANVRIPTSIAASGSYYIGAIADISNLVPDESDENNNAAAGNTIAVTKVYPDLVITKVSGPSSAQTSRM